MIMSTAFGICCLARPLPANRRATIAQKIRSLLGWTMNVHFDMPDFLRLSNAVFLLSLALLFPARLLSQSDEVHVVPRQMDPSKHEDDLATGNIDPNLNAHGRPLRADVDLVLVPVGVRDASNHPVLDLNASNFSVYENDEPQNVRVFWKEDAPISVGLILDFSKSMSNKLDMEQAAVTEFFKNANPQDDYFVIAISDRPQLIADSTESLDELQKKMGLAEPAGNTSLLDAIYVGIVKMRSARYRRRALLIISDGGDNHSYYNAKQTKKLAQEADVGLYSIGIFDNMPVPGFKTIEEKLGKRLLTGITELTGGYTITADNRDKVPQIAADISRQLREQYVLAYRSKHPQHDGKWRKIKVQVIAASNASTLHVDHKKGYIAAAR